MARHAGIDIGGTKALGVVIDGEGRLLGEARRPTPRGESAIVDTLLAVADDLGHVDTLGIGAAGLVTSDGRVRAAPNLPGIHEFRLAEALGERLGRTIPVDNDATCALLAEWKLGAARGASEVVLVTLGTGIGGALVTGGMLQRGANGFAGEPGHMVVDPNGPPCVCGRRGCWERYASGSGLGRLAREAAIAGLLADVVVLAGGDAEVVRSEHLIHAASEGDAGAIAVLDAFAWWVALGLVNLANVLDPALIVVGGGLIEAAELLMEPVERHFVDLLYAPDARPHPVIVAATLGERAGATGAALLAIR
jgi:glucokinase